MAPAPVPAASSIPRNPYIVGPALAARGFWGRDDVFRIVQSELEQPDHNAVVLFGQRRIGKTSILRNLQTRLPADAFVTVYFDLMNRARRMLSDVLYEIAATIADELGIEQPKPADFESGDGFRKVFLPRAYAAVQGKRLVLLFDEFDVLDVRQEEQLPEASAARAFFPYLRELMINQPQLAFVFVVGRKAGELSIEVKSIFKAARYYRISVLDEESTRGLIRTAEREGTLKFDDAVVERLIALTACHPFFVQLLCQLLFERAFAVPIPRGGVPTLTLANIESTIPKALEAGENVFEWIWDGLPPAERVIFAAVAAGTDEHTVVTEDKLMAILQDSGARILVRELELAPRTLIEWQMLKESEGGYRFFVELMRRWVALRKPLRKVKDELDRINPLADTLYQAGNGFYLRSDLHGAAGQLKQALTINANHLKARLLLAEVFKAQGKADDRLRELAEAYRIDEDGCRIPYETALLERAEQYEREQMLTEALQLYRRALEVSPNNATAMDRRARVLVQRADAMLAIYDYASAKAAYKEAGAIARLADVEAREQAAKHEQKLAAAAQQLKREQRNKAVQLLAGLAGFAFVVTLAIFALPRVLPSPAAVLVTATTATPTLIPELLPTPTPVVVTKTVSVFPSLTTLRVAKAGVYAVAISPDGKWGAVGGDATEISLYDASNKLSPELRQTLSDHSNSVLGLAFSLDSQLLASASADKTIRVYRINSTSPALPVAVLEGHTDKVRSVAFSPNGKFLASGSDDQTVRVWDVAAGKLISTFAEHTGAVRDVAYSPDGSLLASAGDDQSAILRNASSGANVAALRAHTNTVYSVAFSADGKLLATGGNDDAVILWDIGDVQNPQRIGAAIGAGDTVHKAALSPNGQLLAVCGIGNAINLLDIGNPANPQLVVSLREHTNMVWDCAFSADSGFLASASEDGTVKIWRVPDNIAQQTASENGRGTGNQLLRRFSGYAASFSPDGTSIAIGSDNGVMTYDLHTLRPITNLNPSGVGIDVTYSPDGQWLALSNGSDVLILDATNGAVKHKLVGHTELVKAVAWNRDGTLVASGGVDKSIRIWNANEGTLLRVIANAHEGSVQSLDFSPADPGTYLVSATGNANDGAVWEVREGTLITRIDGGSPTVAYNRDGSVIALGGNGVKMLNAGSSASYFFQDQNNSNYISAVCFSPDGKTLAAGWSLSQDSGGTVQLWRVNDDKTLSEVMRFTVDGGNIRELDSSPDGNLLAVTSFNGVVQLFQRTQ